MTKNIYLTPSEQQIYNVIVETDVTSHTEIMGSFPELSSISINKTISSLLKKGYLYPLKRGLYLVQKEPSCDPVIPDPYKMASLLFPGYIGFTSALRLWDLVDYEPFTIYVVTNSISGRKKIGQYEVQGVSFGRKATGVTQHRGVYVSTIPKTFFDCFCKPTHAGGYSGITKSLHSAGRLDWDEFLNYFRKFGSDSLCQKTGYVLDLMCETDYKIPEGVLKYFRGRISGKTRLMPSAPARGKYDSRWRITDNVGEKNLLGWFYG